MSGDTRGLTRFLLPKLLALFCTVALPRAAVAEGVTVHAAAAAQVTFARAGVTLDCRETDTILALSRANALRIPYGCTFGICGTCNVRKTKGEVRMVHTGGISDDDVADGWILTCCSHPVGEVEIDA